MMNKVPNIERPARPGALATAAIMGIFAGGFVGATTNAVNGAVSPLYFITIMRWPDVNFWEASIAQGIFEGLQFGFAFSLVFTIANALITRAECTYAFAIKHVLGIVAAIYVCWGIGGLLAIGLATLSPEFFRRAFSRAPEGFGDMIAYAWVGGSIWGAQLGALLCTILGVIFLHANWRRERMIEGG